MSKQPGKPKGAVIPKSLEWEEFYLRKHVICRALNLCTMVAFFVMGVVVFLLWRGVALQPAIVWGFITSAVAAIVKLIRVLIKQNKE